MLKLINASLVLFIMSLPLLAQESTETKSQNLLQNVSFSNIGFFISPTYQIGVIDDATTHILGGRGGLIFNKKWSIGGMYTQSFNNINPVSETTDDLYLDIRLGGGFIEYTLFSDRLVHLTFPLAVGIGELEMDRELDNSSNNNPFGEESFFFVEPSALIEINVLPFAKFNAGISYRFVGDVSYRSLDESDISGLLGTVGLKIGLFR